MKGVATALNQETQFSADSNNTYLGCTITLGFFTAGSDWLDG